jgi:tetratricopeptide (TPR) repeat protein
MNVKDILGNLLFFVKENFLFKSNRIAAPSIISNRDNNGRAAVIFVHGFHGNISSTWESFLKQTLSDNRLRDWDIFSAGYETNLSVDLPIWTSDPDIHLCAGGLITKLQLPPLDKYDAIVLVAHSMGGLVVQRAILDSPELRQRLAHVILYGTPSAGVSKATLGARLKPQARDMQINSEFIKKLRVDWREASNNHLPFSFTVVAGESDAFIPASSSIDPFPKEQQAVVPGNHLDIVRPDSTDHLSYQLFYKTLTKSRGNNNVIESARLAVENKEFQLAIKLLLPGANGLDANAIVTLSLALESVGRQAEALEVIDLWNQNNNQQRLDPIGVLAGRLKRRWFVSRQQSDFNRALELYSSGLRHAEIVNNKDQAYYHSINVAFMHLASSEEGELPEEATNMAKLALEYANAASENVWSLATIAEALLMLGDISHGIAAYQKAKAKARTLRECESMFMQAITVASRIYGEEGITEIKKVFESIK